MNTPRMGWPLETVEDDAAIVKFTLPNRTGSINKGWYAEVRDGRGTCCFRCPAIADGCDVYVQVGDLSKYLHPDIYSVVIIDCYDRECGTVRLDLMHGQAKTAQVSIKSDPPKLPSRPQKIRSVFDEWVTADIRTTVNLSKGSRIVCVSGLPNCAEPLPVKLDLIIYDGVRSYPVTITDVSRGVLTLSQEFNGDPVFAGACVLFVWSSNNVGHAMGITDEDAEDC